MQKDVVKKASVFVRLRLRFGAKPHFDHRPCRWSPMIPISASGRFRIV